MRRSVTIVLLFCALLSVSCRGKVIPREQMIQVLREMMITDVLIEQKDSLVQLASSSLVYDVVLRKMGYSIKEFENTLTFYLERPDKMRSMVKDLQEVIIRERRVLSENDAIERQEAQKRYSYTRWLEDSLSNSTNFEQKMALLRIMAPDPLSLPVWRMDQDSLYRALTPRVSPVVDTLTREASLPKYLVAPTQVTANVPYKILK